jgi:co-chaperonin GroES (HSP10)
MTIQPLGKQVHVVMEEDPKEKDGVSIPETSKRPMFAGRVIAEGPDVSEFLYDNFGMDKGASLLGLRVMIDGSYSGQKMKVEGYNDGKEFNLCDAERMMGLCDEEVTVKGGDKKGMERCPRCGPANSSIGRGNPFLLLDPNEIGGKRRLVCERCGYSQPA